MKSAGFEWDAKKRKSTLEKHGIDFVDAKRIFDGRPVLYAPSHRRGEQRWMAVGELNGLAISVVFTRREGKIRIITARRASKNEERRHNDKFNRGNDPPQN